MSSTILLIVLLSAHITGLISEQLLKATVGGSVLFPCSLPGYPLTLNWFYWQEGDNLFFRWDNGEEIEIKDNKYKGRFQVFTHEFSSGNISIRLDNISVEDDKNTFFTFVNLYDEQKKVTKQSQKQCIFMLQVSAPYQDLVLTVNHTTNSATCSARGGYPAAQVSWKGLNRSSDEQLDLQDAETSPQEDPTEKTFSITSSVNVTGLKSVTCIVYNPHSNKTINKTMELVEINTADPPGVWITTPTFSTPSQDENGRHRFLIIAAVVLFIILILILAGFCRWYRSQPPDLNPDAAREPVDPNPQDPVQEEAQTPDQAPAPDQAPGPDQDQDPDQAPGPDQDQDPDQAPGPDPDQAPGPDQDQDQDQDPDQAPGPDQDQDQAPGPDQDQAPGPDQDQAPGPDQDQDPDQAPGPDQDQDQDPDQAPANQPPVEHDPQDGAEAEADPSEDAVLLSEDRAVFHCQTKTSEGTADRDTCEDAAASPEKEKLLEKENGNEDSASD